MIRCLYLILHIVNLYIHLKALYCCDMIYFYFYLFILKFVFNVWHTCDIWQWRFGALLSRFNIYFWGKTAKLVLHVSMRMQHAIMWGLGRILGIVGWDPSDSKSNRLHVDIFRFFFINLRCIFYNPLEWWVVFLKSWTSTAYFSNSTWFIHN